MGKEGKMCALVARIAWFGKEPLEKGGILWPVVLY
jgi:hypothetical protein